MKRFHYVYLGLIFCFPLSIFANTDLKARICLNMIVKNESHVIQRALSSVKALIDYWVIVDTGSSDGTQDLIRESLKDISGELYERPWQNFGYNRTEALQLARNKADYILFMDADDLLEYSPGFVLPQLHADIYWASWQSRHVPSFSYMKPLIVKDSLFCYWEGVIHEYITCDQAMSQLILPGITYIFTSEGHRSKNPKKFDEAAQILEMALQDDPHNSRYVFYLAESYRDANRPQEALAAYQRRVGMGGWNEEIFWSELQTAHLKKTLKYSQDEIILSYEQAHRLNPSRAEPIYYLAEIYNQNGSYEDAYQSIKNWQNSFKAKQSNILFQVGWIEDYGIDFQLSIAAYYVGQYQESLDLNNQLLTNPQLPQPVCDQVLINREFSLRYFDMHPESF